MSALFTLLVHLPFVRVHFGMILIQIVQLLRQILTVVPSAGFEHEETHPLVPLLQVALRERELEWHLELVLLVAVEQVVVKSPCRVELLDVV